MTAEEKLETLARELSFDRRVMVHRCFGAPVERPARGDGPLTLTLDTHTVTVDLGYAGWSTAFGVAYGHVALTHVPSGKYIDRITHPFTTERAPNREWLIPATPAGVRFAERLCKSYLALDVPWAAALDTTAVCLYAQHKVSSVKIAATTVAKIEREAARRFRDELRHREWPGVPTSQHAALVSKAMRSRFFWSTRR